MDYENRLTSLAEVNIA